MKRAIKLKVRSSDIETRIPVNGMIYYDCEECLDTGVCTHTLFDEIHDSPCPFCWRGQEPDMTGATPGDR